MCLIIALIPAFKRLYFGLRWSISRTKDVAFDLKKKKRTYFTGHVILFKYFLNTLGLIILKLQFRRI